MISRPIQYLAPQSIGHALKLINKLEDAKIIAGGQSLIPMMNLGLLTPQYLVDLKNVKGLQFIDETSKTLKIGSMVRHHEIATSAVVRKALPMLAEAAGHIGDMHIRHRGTIGGSICHADPAGDYGAVLLAADAILEVRNLRRRRFLRAREFFKDAFTTALKPDEILIAIHIPKRAGWKSSYEKLEFVSGGFAVASAAVMVEIKNGGRLSHLVVGVGGVERRPAFFDLSETFADKRADASVGDKLASYVSGQIREPLSDIQADGEYRRAMAGILAKRAFMRCLD
ncbi:MAG: xanthine dehydrogenase family protein subunit M [Candidatus Caldarchaeum sp.]